MDAGRGGALAATTYTDGGLTSGTTYYYVVRAVNAGGVGPWSDHSSATTHAASSGDLNADGDGCGGVGRAERDGDGRERERDHGLVECGGRRKRL